MTSFLFFGRECERERESGEREVSSFPLLSAHCIPLAHCTSSCSFLLSFLLLLSRKHTHSLSSFCRSIRLSVLTACPSVCLSDSLTVWKHFSFFLAFAPSLLFLPASFLYLLPFLPSFCPVFLFALPSLTPTRVLNFVNLFPTRLIPPASLCHGQPAHKATAQPQRQAQLGHARVFFICRAVVQSKP